MDETPAKPDQPAAVKSRRRRWYQFNLRTLLIFVTLAGCGFGWLAWKVREAQQQAAAVEAVRELRGVVLYDYDFDADGHQLHNSIQPGPAWLRTFLGDDFFRRATWVDLIGARDTEAAMAHLRSLPQLNVLYLEYTQLTDADLQQLKGLSELKLADLEGTGVSDAGLEALSGLTQLEELNLDYNSEITDVGLRHLSGLNHLRWLTLQGTAVTAAEVARLQQALPNCLISH